MEHDLDVSAKISTRNWVDVFFVHHSNGLKGENENNFSKIRNSLSFLALRAVTLLAKNTIPINWYDS